STLRGAGEMIARTARPNIKIMFDVFHVGVAEGDILTKLEYWLPHIGHVQIAAVPSRAEPDEGEVHFPAIFAALD
ncbi:TIM barrel protein, partial [Stenotrophomonas maltophilia]|uniref:TIM barrel protein n=1 Tax=Stenotrophomonas maltophilia TaxID=40324 RepID=UPI0013DBB965